MCTEWARVRKLAAHTRNLKLPILRAAVFQHRPSPSPPTQPDIITRPSTLAAKGVHVTNRLLWRGSGSGPPSARPHQRAPGCQCGTCLPSLTHNKGQREGGGGRGQTSLPRAQHNKRQQTEKLVCSKTLPCQQQLCNCHAAVAGLPSENTPLKADNDKSLIQSTFRLDLERGEIVTRSQWE
jgi:hypothetical protein